MPEKDSLDPAVPALNHCPGCDEYGASHTTPSIEHPAVSATCEYCGPACYRGAAHNARVEDGARYTDDPVPAVPAQEAPRESDWVPPVCVKCNKPLDGVKGSVRRCSIDGHHCIWRPAVPAQEAPRVIYRDADGNYPDEPTCPLETMNWGDGKAEPLTEPQAGAQVPSQDEIPDAKTLFALLSEKYGFNAGNAIYRLSAELVTAQTALQHITAYATEAAKTPITRESISDAPQVDEYPIPKDLKVDWDTLNEAYVTPVTLEWAIEREESMQSFARKLIGRIAILEAELEARKLTELAQCDELQGFCRLVLSEIGK